MKPRRIGKRGKCLMDGIAENANIRFLINPHKKERSYNMSNEHITKFRTLLQEGIDFREKVLFPKNSIMEISQSVQDQEVTRKEQALLKCILAQFDKTFWAE